MEQEKNETGIERITNKKLVGGIREWSIVFALLIVWMVLSFVSPYFLTVNNIMNIFLQSSNIMMISIGLTFILICGQMDLSVGSIEALASAVVAVSMVNLNLPIPVAVAVALVAGAICGLVSGTLVARFAFPPFIATLSMQTIARGAALIITKGAAVFGFPDSFKLLGQGRIFTFLPVAVLLYLILLLVAHIILRYTQFGVNVYAVGSNEQAANLSGIDVHKMKIAVFMISGVMAALGGIIMTARLSSGQGTIGEADVMDGVASVVIGGTSMRGGIGSIKGTLIGVLIISSIRNGLNLLAVDAYWQQVAIGVIIIISILIDQFSKGEFRK